MLPPASSQVVRMRWKISLEASSSPDQPAQTMFTGSVDPEPLSPVEAGVEPPVEAGVPPQPARRETAMSALRLSASIFLIFIVILLCPVFDVRMIEWALSNR